MEVVRKVIGKKCFIGNSFYDIFIVIYIFFIIEVNALYKHEERSMVAIKDELGDQWLLSLTHCYELLALLFYYNLLLNPWPIKSDYKRIYLFMLFIHPTSSRMGGKLNLQWVATLEIKKQLPAHTQ